MKMPEKFHKLLELIHDQLFYSVDRSISINESECATLGLSTADVQQILGNMEVQGLIGPHKHLMNFKDSGKPTQEDREYIKNYKGIPDLTGGVDAELLQWVLLIPVTAKFDEFYMRAPTSGKPDSNIGIFYNLKTGVGYTNGKEFKFKDHQPEFFLFGKLYEQIGESIKRVNILTILKCEEGPTATYSINDLAKKIRTRTGLKTRELVVNNGNITLVGRKLDDFPKQP